MHRHYLTLGPLMGDWLSEQSRLETPPVKNQLLTLAKGSDGDLHPTYLIGDVVFVVTAIQVTFWSLALNPAIGSLE